MTHRRFEGGRLIVASHNPGKVREITELLAPFSVPVVSAADLDLPEPEETCTTFTANAELKAKAAAMSAGGVALADDSGLAVTALDDDAATTSLDTAVRAAQFLRSRLWDSERGRLLRRFRDGRSDIDGYSEDYAFVVWGLLELFQAGGDPTWLDWARQLQATQNELFGDDETGGWFSTTGEDPTVLLHLKEDYDGAEPSAGSVAVGNLLTLGHLSGGDEAADYGARAARAIRRVVTSPQAARVVPLMAAAASTFLSGAPQVVIVGARAAAATMALQRVLVQHYLPGALTLIVEPGVHQNALATRLPWLGAMVAVDGEPTAYLCRDFVCQAPVTDPDAFCAQLETLVGHTDR